MNLSDAAVVLIREHITDWTLDDASILASLDAETLDNPAPQGRVAAPVYESALLGLLDDVANGSIVKLINWPNFGLLKSDIEAGNRDGIGLWCQALTLAGIITQGECGAILSYIGSTIPDPAWPAKVSWASVNIGRPLDLEDIAASRPEQSS